MNQTYRGMKLCKPSDLKGNVLEFVQLAPTRAEPVYFATLDGITWDLTRAHSHPEDARLHSLPRDQYEAYKISA